MKKVFETEAEREVLVSSPLFSRVDASLIDEGLSCLQAVRKTYDRGEVILLAGGRPTHTGVLLDGRVSVERSDAAGNTSIVAEFGPGEVFGEALAYAGESISPVTVTASTQSAVLLVPNARLTSVCDNVCNFHPRLTENLVRLIAKRNMHLNRKLDVLGLRTTREKLIEYLSEQQRRAGVYGKADAEFSIPLTKSELANYLCVDRSAMSRELSRLRDDGIIDFHRNRFRILA